MFQSRKELSIDESEPRRTTDRQCILSLATDDKRFPEGLARLRESVNQTLFRGELLFWSPGNFPKGCPAHRDVPFAFKPHCFLSARARGKELALWLDAACVALEPLDGIFRAMRQNGYVLFQGAGGMVGEWASDAALEAMALSREQAMRIPEISAGVIGLNLKHPVASEFLDLWQDFAVGEVAFRGAHDLSTSPDHHYEMKWNRRGRASSDPRVLGHRHDQSVAGVLAHRLRMKLTKTGIRPYSNFKRWIPPGTVIVVDRDVGKKDSALRTVEQIRRDRYVGGFAQFARMARQRLEKLTRG